MLYRIASIPKGKGKIRKIYIPSEEYKAELRALVKELEEILSKLDIYSINYAFQKGRNCSLHAMQHLGHQYTLSMDIEEFFDSISKTHVAGLLPARLIKRCFIEGCPRQGLPTSPLISSIAFLRCDKAIIEALKRTNLNVVYTRYADDLVFSFNDLKDEVAVKVIVKQAVEKHGFKINDKKTRLQSSKNGRVIITGVAIDKNGIHATRRTKKKIRAAIHQMNKPSAQGLVEWSKCKLPNGIFGY